MRLLINIIEIFQLKLRALSTNYSSLPIHSFDIKMLFELRKTEIEVIKMDLELL